MGNVDESWGPAFIAHLDELAPTMGGCAPGDLPPGTVPAIDFFTWMNWVDRTFDRAWPFCITVDTGQWSHAWPADNPGALEALHWNVRQHWQFAGRNYALLYDLARSDPGRQASLDTFSVFYEELRTFDWWLGRVRASRRQRARMAARPGRG